jgi:polar amino acid transport system permease protein
VEAGSPWRGRPSLLFGGNEAIVHARPHRMVSSSYVLAGVGKEFFNGKYLREMLPGIITEGMRNTVMYTAIAFTAGIVIGLVLALGRLSRRAWLRIPAATFIDIIRGLPALLVIVAIGYGFPIAYKGVTGNFWRWPLGSFGSKYMPGCLALSLVSAAYLAESIRAGIQAVPKGQMEAARSLGMSHGMAMRKVVLPQAFRIIIPPLTNELAALFKDTSLIAILGVSVGGREILLYARTFQNARANTTPLVAGGIAYLVITIPLLQLVAYLDRRSKEGSR